ncbi:MAG: hypothetical protein H6736_03530 [Alphaproteobacteria bacterium]|nr:hypothetical protein [Alphaproteobacteria bacterium]
MYSHAQLARAIETWSTHPDPAVKASAAERIRKWTSVILGMEDGSITVGSRTPVADTPAWVTLEVAHGGFATGRLLAAHDDAADRNEQALGAGREALIARLHTGAYRVDVPEQGAIPVALRLLELGHTEAALDLLEVIAPWMDRLDFTPVPAEPHPEATAAFVRTSGEVADALVVRQPQAQVVAMNLALGTWRPLQDELAALLAPTTVDGIPGSRFPEGWWDEARELLELAEATLADHPTARRPRDPRGALGGMLAALRAAVPTRDPEPLTLAAGALSDHVRKRGRPGSPAAVERSAVERAHAARPLHSDLARQVGRRLREHPADRGLVDPSVVLGPLDGHDVPPAIAARVQACREAPLDELVDDGIIGSCEVLASVAPRITAAVRASDLADPVLRTLVGRIDQAFRRRRGLLLLDLQHQVRLGELPWIAAVRPLRTGVEGPRASRATLEQIARLAFGGFPHTQLPNPMISELQSLAKSAGVDVPLTEEIAADIFMGTFTRKFAEAARITARALHGTIYGRYYDLPADVEPEEGRQQGAYAALCLSRVPRRSRDASPERLRSAWERAKEWRGRHGSWLDRLPVQVDVAIGGLPVPADAPFTLGEAVLDRHQIADLRRSYFMMNRNTALNGALLEQSLVLTSHGVAPLVGALGLDLRSAAPGMCDRAFAWFADRLSSVGRLEGIERLRATKNAAYAWRQTLLWLAYDPAGPEGFLARTDPSAAGPLVGPVWEGLVRVAGGERFVDERVGGGRRLYGWSPDGPHWIFG